MIKINCVIFFCRVSFGSSKGSMVETLVYETPVQEEPENNHFMDHNGRLPVSMIPVPDTEWVKNFSIFKK